MTEDQLAAIEARADDYNRYERCNELEVARKIIGRDIPALVAEVRRLRELCAECIQSIEDWAVYASDYFKEKHGLDAEIEEYKARLGDTSEQRTEVERLRAQVDALAGLVEYSFISGWDAYNMSCKKTDEACMDEFSTSEAKRQLTAIMNGESEGADGN